MEDKVKLSQIRYSQSDVAAHYKELNKNWDLERFTGADLVQFTDYYVSVDNRRILRANFANKKVPIEQLPCKVYLPQTFIEHGRDSEQFGLSLAWEDAPGCVYTAMVYPRTWRAAVRSRCSYQDVPPFVDDGVVEGQILHREFKLSQFPLEGSFDPPLSGKHENSKNKLRPVYILVRGARTPVSIPNACSSIRKTERVFVNRWSEQHNFRAIRGQDFILEILETHQFKWDAAQCQYDSTLDTIKARADIDDEDTIESGSESDIATVCEDFIQDLHCLI